MEYRSLGATLKDLDTKEGVVDAYWAAFNQETSWGEQILPGAFDLTIAAKGPAGSNRIKLLWQHDPWEPVGTPRELLTDQFGLRAVSYVPPTRRGKDLLLLYEAGVINEHSIGFNIRGTSPDDEDLITEIDLWEGSAVTWGAYSNTPVVSMRSAHAAALGAPAPRSPEDLARQIAAMRRACAGPLTDETAGSLELALVRLEDDLKVALASRSGGIRTAQSAAEIARAAFNGSR
jgi:HK97 family phage prohead protease